MPNRIYCGRPGCEGVEPIRTGTNRPVWQAGSLRTDELEVLLVCALSDLWSDGYAFRLAFEERLERAVKQATGRKAKIEVSTDERSQR